MLITENYGMMVVTQAKYFNATCAQDNYYYDCSRIMLQTEVTFKVNFCKSNPSHPVDTELMF